MFVHVEPVKSGHVPKVEEPPLQFAPVHWMPFGPAAVLTNCATVPPIIGPIGPVVLITEVMTTVESF